MDGKVALPTINSDRSGQNKRGLCDGPGLSDTGGVQVYAAVAWA